MLTTEVRKSHSQHLASIYCIFMNCRIQSLELNKMAKLITASAIPADPPIILHQFGHDR